MLKYLKISMKETLMRKEVIASLMINIKNPQLRLTLWTILQKMVLNIDNKMRKVKKIMIIKYRNKL